MELYKATKGGDKVGGDISLPEDDEMKVLRVVTEAASSPDEISRHTGISAPKVRRMLRKLMSKHLCKEVTGDGGEEF